MRVPSNMLKFQVLVIGCTELLDFHFVFFAHGDRSPCTSDTVCLEGAEPGRPHETFRKDSPGTGIEISIHMFGMAFQLQSSISYRKCDWSQMGANSCCVFIVSFLFFSLGYFPCYLLPFGAKRSNLLHLGAKSLICKLFAAFWSKNCLFWTLFAAFWTLDLLLAENSQAWFRVY